MLKTSTALFFVLSSVLLGRLNIFSILGVYRTVNVGRAQGHLRLRFLCERGMCVCVCVCVCMCVNEFETTMVIATSVTNQWELLFWS